MSQTLTRRGLVVVAPAAIVAAVMPAHAGAHPDAELLALREPYERTWRAYESALAVHGPVEAAWFAAKGSDDAKAPEMIAAEALVDEASAANRKIVEAMCELPARTVEGLSFKARVSQEHEDNLFEELVTSIMDDILAMSGGSNA